MVVKAERCIIRYQQMKPIKIKHQDGKNLAYATANVRQLFKEGNLQKYEHLLSAA